MWEGMRYSRWSGVMWMGGGGGGAEAQKIVEAGMRADAHAFLLGALHDVTHGQRIARVETTGNARGTDDLEDRVVVADLVGAEPLAHICIEIYRYRHHSPFIPEVISLH